MRVLVVNAGSSSLKLTLLGPDDETVARRELAAPRATIDHAALQAAIDDGLAAADAVGHRVVHGGERFREAVVIDDQVESELRALIDLAPLHQPKSIAGIDAVRAVMPDVPEVACFDTAFHATLPRAASTYALPARWRDRWLLRRYGFHGLSHSWVARRVPQVLCRAPHGLRIVSCHLGAGASLCAIADGRSVDTTMGFTPLEGLVMATRSGSVDPGLVLWLLEHAEVSELELADALEHDSGLRGLAGTGDMREVVDRASGGDEPAQLALEVYLHRLRSGIAAMAASLGGVDVLAFTGGVGENASEIRARTVEGLRFLGLELDDALNAVANDDVDVSTGSARARTLRITAREDLEIARQVRAAFGAAHP